MSANQEPSGPNNAAEMYELLDAVMRDTGVSQMDCASRTPFRMGGIQGHEVKVGFVIDGETTKENHDKLRQASAFLINALAEGVPRIFQTEVNMRNGRVIVDLPENRIFQWRHGTSRGGLEQACRAADEAEPGGALANALAAALRDADEEAQTATERLVLEITGKLAPLGFAAREYHDGARHLALEPTTPYQ